MMLINVEVPAFIEKDPTASKKKMLTIGTRRGKKLIEINPSSLGVIQTCGVKTDLSLVRKYDSKGMNAATTFGSAIHGAMETFYRAPRASRILPKDYKKKLELLAHECDGSDQGDIEENTILQAVRDFVTLAAPLRSLPDSDKRSVVNGIWILTHYFETYVNDPFTVWEWEGEPFVERMLTTEVYEDDDIIIELFGTIDAVFVNDVTGQLLVTDHKTSSVVGNQFYSRLKPNHQYSAYILLAQKCLGLETDGFMVNCLQVKPKPKTARGTKPDFPRQITSRSKEDLEEFVATLVTDVKTFLRWQEDGFYPYGPVESCGTYGGCKYQKVCSAPRFLRQNILDADYEGDCYA